MRTSPRQNHRDKQHVIQSRISRKMGSLRRGISWSYNLWLLANYTLS